MKKIKKRIITILLIVLALFIIWAGSLCIFFYIWIHADEWNSTYKTVKTPYDDSFYIQHEIDSTKLSKPTEVRFRVYYNDEEIIFWQDIGGSLFDLDMENRMHIVINMAAEGEVRAYEFNWGILYTVDDGKSFKGAPMISYMEYYTGNEEFAEAYSMLYEQPFYDERFKEHLDMDKRELPDGETAEYIVSESENRELAISEIESLVGKAQRVSRVETFGENEKVRYARMEYDLSDGRVLRIRYFNKGDGENLELYVSSAYIREVYNPEEDQSPEATPTQPAPSSPSPSAAAA